MLLIILFFTMIIFVVYQIAEDNKIKERYKYRTEATALIVLSTHIIQAIARYEMLKHGLCSSENILFPDEIEEINHRIDNAICDVKKHKSELKHVLYTSIVHDNISRRLSNVIHTIDDHLDVLKSEKNKSFDDIITDDLECTINDIQKSM